MAIKNKVDSLIFIGLCVFAFFFSYLPFLNLPFTWLMTFLHEISHGLMALVTGGSVIKINLYLNGSGLCTTTGGWAFLILLSGYLGAIVWGVVVYLFATKINKKYAVTLTTLLSALIIVSGLLWARDLLTIIIMIVITLTLWLIIRLRSNWIAKFFMQFTGIYVLLDAIRAPLHLFDGKHLGDGAKLADLSSIPEIFWTLIWLGAGIAALWYLWSTHGCSSILEERSQHEEKL